VWESPVGHEKAGGAWLVGRNVRVWSASENRYDEYKVEAYDSTAGPAMHAAKPYSGVGESRFDLGQCRWQFDIKQGPAGFAVMNLGGGGNTGRSSRSQRGGTGGEGVEGNDDDDDEEEEGNGGSGSNAGAPEMLYSIPVKGRVWETPVGKHRQGGDWLVGRCIRVYWDAEKKWYPGIVGAYNGQKNAVDSHGNKGPVHDVFYEDGSYLESLETARWQFDLREGAAQQRKKGIPSRGAKVGGLAPEKQRQRPAYAPDRGSTSEQSTVSARRKAYNSKSSTDEVTKGGSASPVKMGRFAPRSPLKGSGGDFSPLGDSWEICSIRREGGGAGGGDIEWEVCANGVKQEWRPDTAVKIEPLFKQKLCE